MGKLILMASVIALASVAYVASPFYAVWTLHEALRTADSETVKRKIAWPSFRASLRDTILQDAVLRPQIQRAGRNIRPTLWQRVKHVFGASLVDRFIETRITPEGLPVLFAEQRAKQKRMLRTRDRPVYGETVEHRDRAPRGARTPGAVPLTAQALRVSMISATDGPAAHAQDGREPVAANWRQKVRALMQRLTRAEFVNLTTVVIELRDRFRNRRSYRATLELVGIEWKLTRVKILNDGPSTGAASRVHKGRSDVVASRRN